ncbi:rhamnulokinase family protein [Georgenia halophila]|uniref:Rhamnulokinase family protein n=1 Tax=Georgenia halophila TaxID=620889 RepID=A0ABP8LDQ4_9MICO
MSVPAEPRAAGGSGTDRGTYVAVDLGASSGRVVAGRLEGGRMVTEEVHRFPNGPVALREGDRTVLHWDVLALFNGIVTGLRHAARDRRVVSVGIDSWAVDYGLLDADGALLGNTVNYRDWRTDGVPDRVFAHLPAESLYARTGLQVQPFNTIFQLVSAAGSVQLGAARRLLLVPDLLGHWLTGAEVAEVTNASTTGLLDVAARTWATDVTDGLRESFGVDAGPLLPPLVEPGTVVGTIDKEHLPGSSDVPLVAVGSHDTASAVAAVPAESTDFAYISCGTWSLVGLELDEPVLTEASRTANFTNELGLDGTVRYLRNVMGLWLLQESMRTWEDSGGADEDLDLSALLAAAADVPALRCVIDVDDPVFLPPGDMPERIVAAARAAGEPVPQSKAEIVRCILDSLALGHRRSIRTAAELSGHDVSVVHVVGGGSQNELLCRLTADATGLPVVAGPTEGTALGNLLVQARALGDLDGGLPELRGVVVASVADELRRYEPPSSRLDWDAAEARLPTP